MVQTAYLKASLPGAGDTFGMEVAISGDTLVVGAPLEESSAVGVNGDAGDNSAFYSGAAYVFVRRGPHWIQQAYLKPSNTGVRDRFGTAVAISGDTIVVGAPEEDSRATGVNGDESDESAADAGAAYVFVRRGTIWSQQAYLKASNAQSADIFGQSVAVSGDTIVIGAPSEDSAATEVNGEQADEGAFGAGAAYVFIRAGTRWSQQAYLKASNAGEGDNFGNAVAVSGDTIVVGAVQEASAATGVNGDPTDNSARFAGAAYVFARDGTNWSQQAYLKASNTGRSTAVPFDPGDSFGRSVAVSGGTVVVGAPFEDSAAAGVNGDEFNDDAPFAGAAYVFVREGTNWSQQAYLKASNPDGQDFFGLSVAVSGDRVVVGATGEDSRAVGVDGDAFDNGATNSGAAYVFVREGATWRQRAYVKASNTGGARPEDFLSDVFGRSVSVSGDWVVVGAPGEDSGSAGVNGDSADNSAANAGAAYVFTARPTGPRLILEADPRGGRAIRFLGEPGLAYRVERAPTPSGPWTIAAASLVAPATGDVVYRDPDAPSGQAFYRVVQP
jgi:hypothetical protein